MSNQSLEATVDPELVRKWISDIGSDSTAAVPLLQAIQTEYRYLPRSAMDLVVGNTSITASQLYGVATFYAQFRLRPVGRHLIKVCHGTACHVSGAARLDTAIRQILDLQEPEQDTAANGSYTMEKVACIGCCSLAPVMVIGEETFPNLKGADAQRSLQKHAKGHSEVLPGDTHKEAEGEAHAASAAKKTKKSAEARP
ncbi:MAG: NAD(P)H-dependent oxidoreductase subunit E [Magnetococcales bacterium]|nr:NAD(P)H-dependent oxidoreductase subunit E [Magnetococcales bacterium]